MSNHKQDSLREAYAARLAWRWVKEHRPDIEELIRTIAEKAYPYPKNYKRKAHKAFPAILQETK